MLLLLWTTNKFYIWGDLVEKSFKYNVMFNVVIFKYSSTCECRNSYKQQSKITLSAEKVKQGDTIKIEVEANNTLRQV